MTSASPSPVSRDLARAALDQLRAEQFLKLLHLQGERRLRYGASLRRAAEMPVSGQRLEITQMFEGDRTS